MQNYLPYRPGQAFTIHEFETHGISRQSSNECAKVYSPKHRPSLHPRRYIWYLFLLGAGATPGISHWKIPMTPSGIKPAVFRLVAHASNKCATAHPKQCLTLRLLMSYIYGAPSRARNANVVYIWTWQSIYTQMWHRKPLCIDSVLKHCAANRKRLFQRC